MKKQAEKYLNFFSWANIKKRIKKIKNVESNIMYLVSSFIFFFLISINKIKAYIISMKIKKLSKIKILVKLEKNKNKFNVINVALNK